MKPSQSFGNYTQTKLLGAKNGVLKGLIQPSLKKGDEVLARINLRKLKSLFVNENQKKIEDYDIKKPARIIQASKKIQKPIDVKQPIPRKPLVDITNSSYSIPQAMVEEAKPVASQPKPIQVEKVFLEDVVHQTSNYIPLMFLNKHSRKTYKFCCFYDRDLNIPKPFSEKTISHSCDNDCTTDEEQIKGAIKNLVKSLESTLKEQREGENTAKKI